MLIQLHLMLTKLSATKWILCAISHVGRVAAMLHVRLYDDEYFPGILFVQHLHLLPENWYQHQYHLADHIQSNLDSQFRNKIHKLSRAQDRLNCCGKPNVANEFIRSIDPSSTHGIPAAEATGSVVKKITLFWKHIRSKSIEYLTYAQFIHHHKIVRLPCVRECVSVCSKCGCKWI